MEDYFGDGGGVECVCDRVMSGVFKECISIM